MPSFVARHLWELMGPIGGGTEGHEWNQTERLYHQFTAGSNKRDEKERGELEVKYDSHSGVKRIERD